MTDIQYRDLTRKAMIREYFLLKENAISILDVSNEITGYIERTYEHDEELQELLDKFDSVVNDANL